jgi:hypothetical protein
VKVKSDDNRNIALNISVLESVAERQQISTQHTSFSLYWSRTARETARWTTEKKRLRILDVVTALSYKGNLVTVPTD